MALCFGRHSLSLVALAAAIQNAQATRMSLPLDHLKGKSETSELHAEEPVQDWVVMFKEGATLADMDAVCAKATNGCHEKGDVENGGLAYVELKATKTQVDEYVKDAPVDFVEVDEPSEAIPTLPERTPNQDNEKWGLERIGYQKRPRKGKGVNIYIFDTGIRTSHQEFTGRVVPTIDWTIGSRTLGSGAACGSRANCANDNNGHGTHVAGTAAGATYGVAPEATLRSVKVLDDRGGGALMWCLTALDWINNNGPRPAVASMSLGVRGVRRLATRFIDKVTAGGVTVVVAAGNSNKDSCGYTPAFCTAAITVGSTDLANNKSSFSNYGNCTDLWAPGTAIQSASNGADGTLKTLSGTSMACPHVSGAAALVLQVSPSLTGTQVQEVLLKYSKADLITDLKAGDTNKLLNIDGKLAGATSSSLSVLCVGMVFVMSLAGSAQ